MSGKLFLTLAIAVVAAAVIAGLLVVGGPIQGRHNKFDDRRYGMLRQITYTLLCVSPRYRRVLPVELTPESLQAYCPRSRHTAADLTDKETGKPYTYHRISDHEFSICANFHDAERIARIKRPVGFGTSFDPNTGCISGRIR